MKKIGLVLLTICMTILFTSCTKEVDDGVITIWHDKEDAVVAVIEKYVDENLPDLDVNLVRKESLTDTLKLVGNNAKTAPDMYMFAHDKIGVFAEIGILEPITTFVSEDDLDGYTDLTIEAATYKDVVYQLPLYYETLLFMYNKDRLNAEDVPTTTEELYTYMMENTDARRYAFVEQHSNSYYAAGWIHGFGGSILDDSGNPTLNSDEVIDALEYHLKFIEYMPEGQAEYATVNTMFYEKKANSIIAGPWLVPLAKENGINLGFATMPVVDETGIPVSPYAGVQGVHVLKVAVQNDHKKENIQELITLLMDPNIGIEMALVSGVAPAKEEAYLDERITSNEMVMAMKEAAINAIPMPNLPEMDVMWVTTSQMLVDINMNKKNIADAVSEAQEESENLIALMK